MAIALTEVNREVFIDGNKLSIMYSVAFTGTYPTGGYTVNNTAFGGSQVFARIDRVWFPWDGQINDNDYRFSAPYAELDNTTTTTNPYFMIHVYHPDTGGGGYTELTIGQTFVQTSYIIVEGVMVGGVTGSTI